MALALGSLLATQGCAALGLTLLTSAAGTAGGTGFSHVINSVVYRTFTVPLKGLDRATQLTLRRMAIQVTERQRSETGRKTFAKAGDREIVVELFRLTRRTTLMRVAARKNWLVYDAATAKEIVRQTAESLPNHSRLAPTTPRARRPAASAARASRGGRGAR